MYDDIKPMLYRHFVAESKDPKDAYRGTVDGEPVKRF